MLGVANNTQRVLELQSLRTGLTGLLGVEGARWRQLVPVEQTAELGRCSKKEELNGSKVTRPMAPRFNFLIIFVAFVVYTMFRVRLGSSKPVR